MSAIENPAFSPDGRNGGHEKNRETFDLDDENHFFDDVSVNSKYWTKRRVAILVVLILLLIGLAVGLYFMAIEFINTEKEYEKQTTGSKVASSGGNPTKPDQTSSITKTIPSAQLPNTVPTILSTLFWRRGTASYHVTTQSEQDGERTESTTRAHELSTASTAPSTIAIPTPTTMTSSTSGSLLLDVSVTTEGRLPEASSAAEFSSLAGETSSVKTTDNASIQTNVSSDPTTSVLLASTTKTVHVATTAWTPDENITLPQSMSLNTTESNSRTDSVGGSSQRTSTQTMTNIAGTTNVTTNVTRSVEPVTSSFETTTALGEPTSATAARTTLAESVRRTATIIAAIPSTAIPSAAVTTEAGAVATATTTLTETATTAAAKATTMTIQTTPLPTTTTRPTTTTTTAAATPPPPLGECYGSDVLCGDLSCIKSHELCDGVDNCSFGEDEMNCDSE